MRRFVIRRNIDRYREQLRSELNEQRRRMLRALLAEEEGKLAAMDESKGPDAKGTTDISSKDHQDRDNRKTD